MKIQLNKELKRIQYFDSWQYFAFFRFFSLTLLIHLLFVFPVSANLRILQDTKVTIKQTNAPLSKIISDIEQKTGYSIIVRLNDVDVRENYSIDEKDKSLYQVLTTLFQDKDINFEIKEKTISIYRPEKAPSTGNEQTIRLSGTVTDEQGEPIIGANVVEKGTTNGIITDVDGGFSLSVPENAILQVSYIGYITQDFRVKNQDVIRITLKEDALALEEVVVVGYGVQKKINLTGAVATVNKETMESRPVSNVIQSLQGAVPGLTISVGGQPGNAGSISLRGQGSLSNEGKTPPYILIDGVPADEATMLGLNPDDIEGISILKDAASSAIYGARAAYGVILVTTKSGSGKKDKIRVNYSNNLDFAAFTVIPDMVNSLQFAEAYNDGYRNAGRTPMFTDEWMVKAKRRVADPSAPATEPYEGQPNTWKHTFDSFDNVNWYDVYYKPGFSSFQQKHTLSLTGTTEKISYYVSAGLRDNNSNMRYGEWTNTQYSGLARLNSKVSEWLDIGLNIRYANGLTKEPSGNFNGDGTDIIYHNMWRGWPMTLLKDPNGYYNSNISNVPYLISGGNKEDTKEQIVLTPSFIIKPLKGLVINFDFTADMLFNTTKAERQNVPEYQVDGTINPTVWDTRQTQTYAMKSYSRQNYFTYNLFATYQTQLDDHSFSVMGGIQQENSKYTFSSAKRFNLLFPSVPVLGLADGDRVVSDMESEWSTFGTFMRINYNYKEKYLLELNGRYDASAKFRKGNRWGFFPSFSLGYNISREEFWTDIEDIVNSLKLRFSLGRLGNQNVASFTFLPQMNHELANFIIGGSRPIYVQAPGLINSDLTWEKSQTINFGLDAAFLSSRLYLNLDVYKRKTYDMFGPSEKLPAVIGTTIPQANNAALSTTGFELVVGWRDRIGNVGYGIQAMLSDYTTKIDKYYNPTGTLTTWSEGRKLGEIWGYQTERYFTADDFHTDASGNYTLKEGIANQDYIYSKWSPGDIKYKDLNGDGKIDIGSNTVDDHGDRVLLGNSTPRFQFGLNLEAQYKGFDARIFFQGVGKRDVWYNDVTFWGFGGRAQSNFTQSHLDYWREDNVNAYYPKPYLEGDNDNKNKQAQSKYILNGAYLRAKNIQVGYTLPAKWLSKISLEHVRLYISGENLFTITDFPDFYDPEAYGKTHPIQKHLSFGINVSL